VRDDRERLLDIQGAIERIEKYVRRGQAEFEANELIQVWIVHHLEIVGEAVRGLTLEFRGRHPEVPWREFAALRNVLAHEYLEIDLPEVWAAVEDELPRLRAAVAAILKQL
jgi:uncharacterized protein with HEPN domain